MRSTMDCIILSRACFERKHYFLSEGLCMQYIHRHMTSHPRAHLRGGGEGMFDISEVDDSLFMA